MNIKYNDGGRSKYYKTSNTRDCVVRAIAIATNKDYKEIFLCYKNVINFQ